MRYDKCLAECSTCGARTTKPYARQHDGLCKQCATRIEPQSRYKCPDCGGPLSAYQHAHRYHCDACTREAERLLATTIDYPD